VAKSCKVQTKFTNLTYTLQEDLLLSLRLLCLRALLPYLLYLKAFFTVL
jgi:hypothetical protein